MRRRLARTARAAASVALAVLAACRPTPAPPPPDASAGAATEARAVSVNLQDASVADALAALAQAAQVPLVVDPEAQPVAGCARLTVLSGGPVPPPQLIRLVGDALAPSGLTLLQTDAGLLVRRAPGAPLPSSCAPKAPDPPDDAGARKPADPEAAQQIIAGIRRVSEKEVEVTQRARDLFVEHLSRVSRARFLPRVRDGRPTGMQIFGIRKDDVLAALGFENGDVLVSVAGLPIDTPDKALEAYAATRQAAAIPVRFERRGDAAEVTFKIVPK
jgi:membrane-associated protease RseP (regulator of RpoE activity)